MFSSINMDKYQLYIFIIFNLLCDWRCAVPVASYPFETGSATHHRYAFSNNLLTLYYKLLCQTTFHLYY